YPGINLVFGQTWTVETAPGANIAAFQMQIDGAGSVHGSDDGQITAETSLGPISLPMVQTADGVPLQPLASESGISFRSSNVLGLSALHPLSIGHQLSDDPSDLVYSTFLGGSGDEYDP